MADAAVGGGPVIGAACIATIAGFAVFALAPSPLVRSFGLLLVIGVATAFLVALTGGLAALGLRRGAEPRPMPHAVRRSRAGSRRGFAPSVCPRLRWRSRPPASARRWALLAVCGWIASAGTEVETDIRELAPPDLAALDDLNELEDQTGISGDVNVTVTADDPLDPAVISWASEFQNRVLARHGFEGANASCADAQICPAISLTDFFGGGQTRARASRRARGMSAASSRRCPASSLRS